MNEFETLLRDTLRDDRRRIPPPDHLGDWVGSEVRRQRRRVVVAGALSAVVAAVGVVVAAPALQGDATASYVASLPDADSGLLVWGPVGSRTDDVELVESAVAAWADQASGSAEPVGDVHLLMADSWVVSRNDGLGVVVQSTTAGGVPNVAVLLAPLGEASWDLVAASPIGDPGTVQAVQVAHSKQPAVVERIDILGNEVDVSTSGVPPSLLLAPSLRASEEAVVGLQRVGTEVSGWRPLQVDDNGWEALPLPEVTAVALTGSAGVGARSAPIAPLEEEPVVSVSAAGRLRLATVVEARRTLPFVDADSRLRADMTVLVVGESRVQSAVIAWLTDREDGERQCATGRSVPGAWFERRNLTLAACTLPLDDGGEVTWVLGVGSAEDLESAFSDLTVTLQRAGTPSRTYDVPGRSGVIDHMILHDPGAPVEQYEFRSTDPFEGTPIRWWWPGSA